MTDEQIMEKVIDILRGYVKDQSLLEKATMETNILKDLKVNSARLVDIIIKCEDVFGTSIDDDDADRIATIGDAVAPGREGGNGDHGEVRKVSPVAVSPGTAGRGRHCAASFLAVRLMGWQSGI